MIGFILFAAVSAASAFADPAGIAVPLTHSINYDPTLSPDGKRMVFLKILEGHEQLFVADADGSNERQLSHDSVDLEDPAWSPDGEQLAYVRLDGPRNSLHVRNIDGTSDRVVSLAKQSAIHPAWMPDSRSILYCTNDDLDPPRKNAAEIYRVDLASGKVTTVISGGVNTFPVPSPDGRMIAFRKMLGINSEVFVADINGKNVRNLTNHPAFEGWPAWSPDGRRIAFAANRNSSYQIFVMNADGGDVTLVANTEGRATSPKWTRDGRSILFSNCWKTGQKSACEIFTVAAP